MEVVVQLEVEYDMPQAVFQGQRIFNYHYSTECMPCNTCNTPPHPLPFLFTRDKNPSEAEQITNYIVF